MKMSESMVCKHSYSDVEDTAIKVFDSYYTSADKIAEKFELNSATVRKHIDHIEQYLISLDICVYEDKVYKTITDVSCACKVSETTICKRLNSGMDWVSAITLKSNGSNANKPITDHLGNEYSSVTEMCLRYSIPQSTYYRRKGKKWSLEKILTTPVKHGENVV